MSLIGLATAVVVAVTMNNAGHGLSGLQDADRARAVGGDVRHRRQWQSGAADDDFIMMLGDQIYGDHRSGKSPLASIPGYRAALLFFPIKKKSK